MDANKVLLGFLMSGPKTGYKIKSMASKIVMCHNLSLNKIYPALKKLEAAGLVRKEIVYQTGKPNKHVYSLTDLGREEFRETINGAPVPNDYQIDFLIKALFFRFLSKDEVVQQFEGELLFLEEQLQDLMSMQDDIKQKNNEDGFFISSTILDIIHILKVRYTKELKKRKRRIGVGP
jgi:DNA-binding PadR family transcriptional regulator